MGNKIHLTYNNNHNNNNNHLTYKFQNPTQNISRKVFLSPGGMYTSYDQGFLGVNQLKKAG